jgi:heat shock protein HtpX
VHPKGLISALEKLHASPIPTEHFSTATQHFYISEPKKTFGENIQSMFSTHPPVEKRIEALRNM